MMDIYIIKLWCKISVHKHVEPGLVDGKKVIAKKKAWLTSEREQDVWRPLWNVLGYHHADVTFLLVYAAEENIEGIESQHSLLQQ